jgi:microcystin-dependent protein
MRGAKLARDVVASVASASSIDLSGVHGDVFNVTGNVGIAAFANGVKGQLFIVRFSGAPLLTHDATVLRCPSNASIQVAAGDRMDLLVYDDSGHCEIVNYTRANGQPLLLPTIVPAGTFFPFAGGTLPGNYLWCDGASYLRSTYPLLFTAISTNWGAADGTHFNVPDLRGIFLRGFNNGVTSDPDASTRIGKVGGATGDNIGSYQNDKVVDHTHLLDKEDVNVPSTSTGSHQTVADARGAGTGGAYEPLATGGIAGGGGAETRPKNAQAPYIIRYQ